MNQSSQNMLNLNEIDAFRLIFNNLHSLRNIFSTESHNLWIFLSENFDEYILSICKYLTFRNPK